MLAVDNLAIESRSVYNLSIRSSSEDPGREYFSWTKVGVKRCYSWSKLGKISDPLEVFIELEHLCLLGPDNLDELRKYLSLIGRPNLIKILDEYEDSRTVILDEKNGYVASTVASIVASIGNFIDTTLGQGHLLTHTNLSNKLTLVNQNNHRSKAHVLADGVEMFPSGLKLLPNETRTMELLFNFFRCMYVCMYVNLFYVASPVNG